MVRYPSEYRKRIYDIESMRVATPAGDLVPFTEVARLTEGTGYASIRRTDQRRTVTVTADVDQTVTNADQVMAELSKAFPDIKRRYPGVELEFGGQKLETNKSFGSLKHAFVIALLLIFVILAGLFRSYAQPFIVMSVIPFGFIGAVAGHFVMGYPLTIASMIGMVALTGVVVNDSMILVTFINRSVAAGTPLREAVIEGGKSRLRPILLTSATTVLGMGPLLLETSFQAKFLIPMGISLAAGLIFATVLTLIAVPSLYLIVIDFKRIISCFGLWLVGRPTPRPA
jgi:multidrug efflux pump subunit AcrB